MVGVVLMKNGDGPAVARRIDAIQAGIKTDYIRTLRHREKGNRFVLIEIENGHHVVPLAREESAMVRGIECHAVIPFATSDRISSDNFIRNRINDCKNVLIL